MTYRNVLIISLVSLLITGSGCQQGNLRVQNASEQEKEQIIPIGKKVTERVLSSLRSELTAAIQKGGPAAAMDICHLKALDVTRSAWSDEPDVTDVKRVTLKSRNPENQPDLYEWEMLSYYQLYVEGQHPLPPNMVQKVWSSDSTVFNYYQPIVIQGMCLICHGDRTLMDTAVVARLDQLYPKDKAFGYQEGDFRGLIKVTVKK